MLNTAIPIAFALITFAMLLNLWRLAAGPSAADRILALDTLTVNAIALVMLYGISQSSTFYFDAALLIAMMGFVGTAALCKFLLTGDVIE